VHVEYRKGVCGDFLHDCVELHDAGVRDPVLLCFTCDPYQPIDEREMVTRFAIQTLHEHHLPVRILTKGGMRSKRDFDLLKAHPRISEYGATLTFVYRDWSERWEPHAALPEERMLMLKRAHRLGIPTWVSLEPVIDPKQTLELIDETHEYVDRYAVGKLNYVKPPKPVDWTQFVRDVVERFERYEKEYHLKRELQMVSDCVILSEDRVGK